MFGIDGELGVYEEKDGLLDGLQSGQGPPIWAGSHLRHTLRVDIHAEQYVLVAYSFRPQRVPRPTRSHPLSSLHLSLSLSTKFPALLPDLTKADILLNAAFQLGAFRSFNGGVVESVQGFWLSILFLFVKIGDGLLA